MHKSFLDKLEYNKILEMLSKFCITKIGRKSAFSLMPSNDSTVVSDLLEETDSANRLILKFGNPPINEIDDIDVSLKIIESNQALSCKSLLDIANILKTSRLLHSYFYKNDKLEISDFSNLDYYFSSLYSNPSLENDIFSKILDENTVDDRASTALYNIRRKQKNLEENIKDKLNSYLHSSSFSKYIREAVITIRNGRYVIPIKEEFRGNVKGFIHDVSSSGSTVFIEPISVFEMNNQINHLKSLESVEIENILLNLSISLLPIISELKTNTDLIGSLDFIFAKAKLAINMSYTKPNISENKSFRLLKARHPLIPKDVCVPIDINLGEDFSTLAITGPNTGGKTVTLKTVGLLHLMALSGLFIPANEKSSIFVFDNIFADIGDEQSIVESLSTFSSHMVNIIDIIKTATDNSLIILDELGSGTDPVEGSSLAISILEYFHNLGTLTLATTHYPEIKNYCLVTDGFENASCEFDVENLKPTYKLHIGIPGKSNAFAISKKLGLNGSILNRASSFMTNSEISIEELLKNIYDDKLKIEHEKEEIEKNSKQIELLRKELENDYSKQQQEKKSIIEKAKQEARNILLDAKDKASSTIKEINKVYENLDSSSIRKVNNLRNDLNNSIKSTAYNISSNTNSNDIDTNTENISKGCNVFISTFNQYGIVLTNPNRNNQVQVQIGSTKINVNINNLKLSTKNVPNTTFSNSYNNINNLKTRNANYEINVIGYNVEEAIFVIDKFLDDSILSNLSTIRIVHGKGTGALKNGIHAFLKKHPHVDTFRLGTYGEGEMGVTIVNLKGKH